MRMENGESFNLMALYTSTRHEREALRQQQQEERQLQANHMLQAQAMEVEEGNAKHYELRPRHQGTCTNSGCGGVRC